MKNRKFESWTTNEEIRLIDRLGSYQVGNKVLSYREHLENYIAGANKRVKWENLDRQKIMQHAYSKSALQK